MFFSKEERKAWRGKVRADNASGWLCLILSCPPQKVISKFPFLLASISGRHWWKRSQDISPSFHFHCLGTVTCSPGFFFFFCLHLVYFTVSQWNVCLRLFPVFPAMEGCFANNSKFSTEGSTSRTCLELMKCATGAQLCEVPRCWGNIFC